MHRLTKTIAALLVLSIALQIASYWAALQIGARFEASRRQTAVAAGLRDLAERYGSTTYLALVALASSDWDMLLTQQATAKEIGAQFQRAAQALLDGGPAHEGGREVDLLGIVDPEIHATLASVPALWDEVRVAHVRVLRSENRSITSNPDLETFRLAVRNLVETLAQISEQIRNLSTMETQWLDRALRAIPLGAFLLTLALGAFVVRRILVPFAHSVDELARSEGALRVARDGLEVRVAERTAELARAHEALLRANDDLERRVKERTHELRETQSRAVELARQAGMTELATNVLHNVGNVLNSVNTSATLLGERLKGLRIAPLARLTEMLDEHRSDLAGFVAHDERGRHLPEYLGKLGQHLLTERQQMLEMSSTLLKHVEHIRAIVDVQQSYATSSSLVEETLLGDVLDEALRITVAAFERHSVQVEHHIPELPTLVLDRHKVLQILLNLLSNAKYALEGVAAGERRIVVRADSPAEGRVRIQISDNGMGIAPELLTKVFQHGFTTRKAGHGFGLHSCALAASAMGGSLIAESPGPGKGATFTLELPCRPEAHTRRLAERAEAARATVADTTAS
jgi:two-component system, NtrC family, sensor kinase